MNKILFFLCVITFSAISCKGKTDSASTEVQVYEHYDTVKNATLIYLSPDGFVKHMGGMSVLHGFVKQTGNELKWTAPPQQGNYLDSQRKVLDINVLQALVKQVPAPIPPPNATTKK